MKNDIMKSYKYITISLLPLIWVLGSCQDRVLDLTPISTLTEANFYQTAKDMDQAVLGIYSSYQSRLPRDWALLEMPTDHLHMSSYRHIGGLEAINNLDFQPQNDLFRTFWQASYNGVFRANAVLANLDNPDDYTGTHREQLEGEAKFMRALFYFDLVRAFGGVPAVTGILSVSEAQAMPRASIEEIYALIVADLQSAVALLPMPENTAKGRASRGAAVALLGKVYIYMEDWANAYEYLDMISQFNYALEEDFASLWTLQNEDNEEVIFAMKYLQDLNGHVLSSDFIPYFGVEGVSTSGNETADLSWSLHKKFLDGDSRKDATITEYWRAPGSDDPLAWRPYISKFAVPHNGRSSSGSGLDLPVLRLADILLLKAEALYYLDRREEALVEINKVRNRAFKDPTFNYELSDIADPEAFVDIILLERQLELALENERWFDLVRTDRFMAELAEVEWDYNITLGTAQVVKLNPQPRYKYFPIPMHEIDQANPGVIVQNEGY